MRPETVWLQIQLYKITTFILRQPGYLPFKLNQQYLFYSVANWEKLLQIFCNVTNSYSFWIEITG